MSSSNNINGMRAQNWKELPVQRIEAAASQPMVLSNEQQQLFDALVGVLKAAAQDIHGTAENDKYRYIVDLIVHRTKSAANDGINDAVEELKTALDASAKDNAGQTGVLLKNAVKTIQNDDAKYIKTAIDSALTSAKFEDAFSDGAISKLAKRIVDEEDKHISKRAEKAEKDLSAFFKKQLASSKNSEKTAVSSKDLQYIANAMLGPIETIVKNACKDAVVKSIEKISKITATTSSIKSQNSIKHNLDASLQVPAFDGANVARDRNTGRFVSYKDQQRHRQRAEAQKKDKLPDLSSLFASMKTIQKQIASIQSYISNTALNERKQQKDEHSTQSTQQNNTSIMHSLLEKLAARKTQDIVKKVAEPATSTANNASAEDATSSAEEASGIAATAASAKKASPTAIALSIMSKKISKSFMKVGSVLAAISGKVAELAKKVLATAAKPFVKMLMSPGGMYAIGFLAGYVWTKWLKKWVMPIAKFVSKLSGSQLVAALLGAAGIAGLVNLVLPALLPLLLPAMSSFLLPAMSAMMSALPILLPIAAIAAGTAMLVHHFNEADEQREENLEKDNQTTKAIINGMKEQAKASKEVRDKLSSMNLGDEKQAALKDRLEKLKKAKRLYKDLEQQEKEAYETRLKLNSGFRSLVTSADELRFWQEKENSIREQKLKLLKDNNFDTTDMRDRAVSVSKDKSSEEQKLAREIAENEIMQTGDISKATYDLYADTFKIKGSYEMNKDKIVKAHFADARQAFAGKLPEEKLQQLKPIDMQLQAKSNDQQKTMEAIGDGNSKIIDAIEKDSKSQQDANKEMLQYLKDIKIAQLNYTAPVQQNTMNTVAVVSQPKQNMAAIENGRQRQLL